MNLGESQQYILRWRGREMGPYSLAEINRRLDEHEIGTGHEIEFEGRWIALEEFLAEIEKAQAAERALSAPPATTRPVLARVKGAPGQTPPVVVSRTPPPFGAKTPPKPPSAVSTTGTQAEQEDATDGPPRLRLLYALLAVCFGFLGVHNFYARHWLTGVLQLLLSAATSLLGFGIIAPWLWALVEAVVVRRDGKGTEMI